MNLKYTTIANIVINIKSLIVIFISNIIDGILIILKKFYVGSITKATNNKYFALSKRKITNSAIKALFKTLLNYKFKVRTIKALNKIEEI